MACGVVDLQLTVLTVALWLPIMLASYGFGWWWRGKIEADAERKRVARWLRRQAANGRTAAALHPAGTPTHISRMGGVTALDGAAGLIEVAGWVE